MQLDAGQRRAGGLGARIVALNMQVRQFIGLCVDWTIHCRVVALFSHFSVDLVVVPVGVDLL